MADYIAARRPLPQSYMWYTASLFKLLHISLNRIRENLYQPINVGLAYAAAGKVTEMVKFINGEHPEENDFAIHD